MDKRMQPRVMVNVYDGAYLVETRACLSATMPTGEAGVFYRGLLHPLGDDNRIDLATGIIAPSGLERPDDQDPEHHFMLVPGDYSGYLLVAGSVILREGALTTLRKMGAAPIRTGPYLGEPWGNWVPDWFIRFELPADADLKAVELAVSAWAADNQVGHPLPDEEIGVTLRLRLIASELAEARTQAATLAVQNARLQVEQAEALTKVNETDADADEISRLRVERDALAAALANEQIARAEAAAAAAAPAAAAADDAHTTERHSAVPKTVRSEIETVLRTLMPRLRLLRDSLVVIAVEYRDRGPLYRALIDLQSSATGWPPNWKKLHSANGWWERHVSDGTTDAGRVYARPDGATRDYEVLVSEKREQNRDIAWLRQR